MVHLERKDDQLALRGLLHVGFAVRLEAREGWERDLLLPRILHPSKSTLIRAFSQLVSDGGVRRMSGMLREE